MATCTGDKYTQTIERGECIGNSLYKINSNFKSLDIGLCEVSDATEELSTINGILSSNGSGSFGIAVSGVDYYVPNTNLFSANIVATGTASVSGDVNVNGTIKAAGDVIAFSSSDQRLKTDIKPLTNALHKVSNIKGVSFNWNEDLQDVYKGKDVGVLAQEVEKVLPESVVDRHDGYKAVKYEKIVPLLIEAIKELNSKIEHLENQLH
jgi:hypothetical protein